jgi:SAM-dependent methyltransferase
VNVVACDVSANFLQCARERTSADLNIEYLQIDATDREQLLSLGIGRFDSAVCSMAMMDMPTIEPLLCSLPKLLKPGGRFVFSLPHPCFNSNQASMTAELVNDGETARQIYSVTVRSYLKSTRAFSIGIVNQPEAHYFFHRPLSEIFQEIFRAGMIVDRIEEPAFAGGAAGGKNAFSWANRPEIPPAIVIRTALL